MYIIILVLFHYILPDGSTTPTFPIKGYDEVEWANLSAQQKADIEAKGLFRYETPRNAIFQSIFGTINKGLRLDLSSVPQSIKDNTLGFFIVRGERKADLISQGIVVPTIRVPAYDFTRDDQINNIANNGNYYRSFDQQINYKNFPVIDGLVEPWVRYDHRPGDNDYNVILRDGTNRIDAGYMPIAIRNFEIPNFEDASNNLVRDKFAWAFFSADYILNESRYITALQRSNLGYSQWKSVTMLASNDGILLNKFKGEDPVYNVDTTMFYKFQAFNSDVFKQAAIDSIDYVGESSFATGNDFIGGLSVRFRKNGDISYQARSFVDGYFGIKIPEIFDAQLNGSHPYNMPNIVWNEVDSFSQTDGTRFNNVGRSERQAYLLSIYPRASGKPIDDINLIYDTLDGITYHQISDRLTWDDAGSTLDVYGGDCYIGLVHKKLNRSGYTLPTTPSEDGTPAGNNNADNINQGLVFSFMQECEYNPALRLPYLNDAADPEKRSFYPYKSNGEFLKYREYRLPETNKTNQGYAETERPKNFLSLPSNIPFIASNFFTRIVHSEKHVPNAFQNGYRSFVGVNYEDYDPAMGEIVRLFTHRDQLFVVFEHGIGIGPVSQRIQTGSDTAGAIFVEPSGVLPPYLSFASQVIGSQHGNATIQTPSGIYGVDVSRRKIWQFRENLMVISDNGFQSYMDKLDPLALKNPRLGYDPNYHEVIFTFGEDNYEWTLCFKEGLERFTSFYSYFGEHYAHKSKDFYSFNGNTQTFDIHNAQVRTIYGNIDESYVEFVFNPSPNIAKVTDYLNIISNEIAPKQIDLYTYNVDTYKEDVLDESKMFQHAVIEQGIDIFTEENRIRLRDRKFVAQVPHVKYINDVDWGQGRMRNKYVIIRLTYETDQKVEVLSVITDYRISAS